MGGRAGKYMFILTGAVLNLLPLVYWGMTEGQRPLYEPVSFFPHYFLTLLFSAAAAMGNCLIRRKLVKDRLYYVGEYSLCSLIFFLYLLFSWYEKGGRPPAAAVVVCLLLFVLYEMVQGCFLFAAERLFGGESGI